MKNTSLKFLLLLLCMLSAMLLHAQTNDEWYSNIDKYKNEEIKTEFSDRFKKDADKKDFKRLREFLSEKENVADAH